MKRLWRKLAAMFGKRPPNGAFGRAGAKAAAEMRIEVYRAATGKTEIVATRKA